MKKLVIQNYAGFWLRFCAFLVDTAVLCAALFMFSLMFGIPMMTVPSAAGAAPTFDPYMLSYNLFSIVATWLYYALFESSKWQATLGKRLLSIKVTDTNGNRISFARATGRYFAKILSSLIFCIGYIMIAFTKRKQGLHDMIAETLVVRE